MIEIVEGTKKTKRTKGKCRGWSVQGWFGVEVLQILLAVAFGS
jgi:hypothetical protein